MESSDTAALLKENNYVLVSTLKRKTGTQTFLYVQKEINRFCSSVLVPITVKFILLREHELTKCNWCMLLSSTKNFFTSNLGSLLVVNYSSVIITN